MKLGDAVRVVPAAARRRDGATATRAMPKVTKRTERDARELVDASGAIVADDGDALRDPGKFDPRKVETQSIDFDDPREWKK